MYICNYPWGKYLGGAEECGRRLRLFVDGLAPNTLPAMAKAGANYMNSQLIKMEALANGYVEGIALDALRVRQRRFGREHLPGPIGQADHGSAGQLRFCRESRATQ